MEIKSGHAKLIQRWMIGFYLLNILFLGGPLLDNAVVVFLTDTQPDNLFCLHGFMMFTDVLTL